MCGELKYEAEVDPDAAGVCHCSDCQTLSGSAFRTYIPALEGSFKFLTGAPKHYVKKAQSGVERALGFCPECGTHIYSAPVDSGSTLFGIRTATTRQRDLLPPKVQVWCESAQPWAMNIPGIAALDES